MKYVVLGASAAGVNGIRTLRQLDPDCEIVLISKDKEIYSRCILHQYLSGERTLEQLCFVEKDFEDLYKVNWLKGRACSQVRPQSKEVILDNQEVVSYDKLLIASGANTFLPPVKNLEHAKNAVGFRNLEDIEILKEKSKTAKHIVIMGAGLVGLDCAIGLLSLGVKATLVEFADWLLSKQLDKRAANTYEEALHKQGVMQYYGTSVSEVILDDSQQVKELLLSNGEKIPCDFLVVTVGIRSNTGLLEGSGLTTSKFGLIFDEYGKTSDDSIYGAGDISGIGPIWPVAVKEGIIAASNMAGTKKEMSDFFASKSTMNFLGVPSMSLGDVNIQDEEAVIVIKETKDSYKKIIHKDGMILGAILQGDLAYSGILQQLIASKIDISRVKKPLFDIDYSDFFHIDQNFEFYFER